MKGKPVIINFNISHYRSMKQDGGSILSSILPALIKVSSTIVPALTKTILPGLATGVSSALDSVGIDTRIGNGLIDDKMRDIVAAMAIITNEIEKSNKNDKAKFDQHIMSGNG